MKLNEILSKCDHTLLAQGATWAEIKAVCDDGMKYNTASVCIPASHVKQAKEYVGDKLAICTVIGFPNGYSTTAVKVFECKDALANGADEIDTVINIGHLKDGRYDEILAELKALKEACGEKILKVVNTALVNVNYKIGGVAGSNTQTIQNLLVGGRVVVGQEGNNYQTGNLGGVVAFSDGGEINTVTVLSLDLTSSSSKVDVGGIAGAATVSNSEPQCILNSY